MTQSNSPDISYGTNEPDVPEENEVSVCGDHDLTICERDLEMEQEARSHHFERNHAIPSFNRNITRYISYRYMFYLSEYYISREISVIYRYIIYAIPIIKCIDRYNIDIDRSADIYRY